MKLKLKKIIYRNGKKFKTQITLLKSVGQI